MSGLGSKKLDKNIKKGDQIIIFGKFFPKTT
jgi:hypothetical protein